jgi:hypothetical protein
MGNSSGILPTPDPTVGSCVSEEDKDVALQLMRLGEMPAFSHGRTSASTLDETFSGRADAASSTGVTSESEDEEVDDQSPVKRQKLEYNPILPGAVARKPLVDHRPTSDSTEGSSDGYDDGCVDTFNPTITGEKPKGRGQGVAKPRAKTTKTANVKRVPNGTKTKVKAGSVVGRHMSIASTSDMSPTKREFSVSSSIQDQVMVGGIDLSFKPRCQRCRKSKKGCDRQRPCQRCKDAGIPAEECVSEDETNGRKGRYGRHMGVKIKADALALEGVMPAILPAGALSAPSSVGESPDKSKKRKRPVA